MKCRHSWSWKWNCKQRNHCDRTQETSSDCQQSPECDLSKWLKKTDRMAFTSKHGKHPEKLTFVKLRK